MTAAPERRHLTLLAWVPNEKGGALLLGRCRIRLPSGLEIDGIGVFQKDGRRWATLPAEPMRDRDGQLLKDQNGKVRYRALLKWATRELQDNFSIRIFDLIEAEHGPVGEGGR